MQHSPTEVKKRLDQAVDPDGNVMDLVAVLEIVSILEKLPLTKEALEKTRIGRTINLLRKKTENAELAKRAKKLVKKWQTLVVSHLEALRIADSPLNGQQSSSPQINGVIAKEGERPQSAGSDKLLDKWKLLEGKRKRKRESSSSESSPIIFSKNAEEVRKKGDCEKASSLPNPRSKKQAVDTGLSTAMDRDSLQKDGGTKMENIHIKNSLSDSQELTKNNTENLSLPASFEYSNSCDQPDLDGSNNYKSNGDGGCYANQNIAGTCVEDIAKLDISHGEDGIQCGEKPGRLLNDLAETDNLKSALLSQTNTQPVNVHNTCNSSSNAVLDDDLFLSQDSYNFSQEVTCSHEQTTQSKTPLVITDNMLDVSIESVGITGRYGSDGKWYAWTDVMPISDGSLNILPYVILD